MQYVIYTLCVRQTGEVCRYVIACQGDDAEAMPGEVVTANELLAQRLGAPVTILARRPPLSPGLRIKLDNWRDELGIAPPSQAPTGDDLAAAFFAPMDGAEG